ncbi:GNAT family N-acetyltransferase [Thermoclostridium caenicola]|uniref:Predicted acetyltransferase n=1 Tax=Thermoclostridium caenicola TaxID=659425 RepID=A0A1M6JD61_9FIRM|nr:GNAT family N-acetyltransferase [Thermoclostridium caenicola]SHJ44603.1 Predicted acetyltransferase [Thermoclostridium caenicola]
MSSLELVLANIALKEAYLAFIAECRDDIIATNFDAMIPLSDTHTVEADIEKLTDFHLGKGLPDNWVPGSTYWLIEDKNRIIGTVNIRHWLNEALMFRGGHISYYIRPSERGKGYGTRMLTLALERCREMGLEKVLITCKKDNSPSAKIIQKHGGVLASEGVDGPDIIQRYWIQL